MLLGFGMPDERDKITFFFENYLERLRYMIVLYDCFLLKLGTSGVQCAYAVGTK